MSVPRHRDSADLLTPSSAEPSLAYFFRSSWAQATNLSFPIPTNVHRQFFDGTAMLLSSHLFPPEILTRYRRNIRIFMQPSVPKPLLLIVVHTGHAAGVTPEVILLLNSQVVSSQFAMLVSRSRFSFVTLNADAQAANSVSSHSPFTSIRRPTLSSN